MEPLILRLLEHMKFVAFTENGCALVARLRRPYDPDDVKSLQEDCEILARSIPLSMLNIPGVPALAAPAPRHSKHLGSFCSTMAT